MDTDKLLNHSRSRFEHTAAKRVLKEKYQGKLIFAYSGGMWKAGPELLSTLQNCLDKEVVILDLYDTPIKIVTEELYKLTQQRWQEQMNAWFVEYSVLNQQR